VVYDPRGSGAIGKEEEKVQSSRRVKPATGRSRGNRQPLRPFLCAARRSKELFSTT